MNVLMENLNRLKMALTKENPLKHAELAVNRAIESSKKLQNGDEQPVLKQLFARQKEVAGVILHANDVLIRSLETQDSSFLEEVRFEDFKKQHEELYEKAKKELGI